MFILLHFKLLSKNHQKLFLSHYSLHKIIMTNKRTFNSLKKYI
jgi:hypothetical protein